MELQSQHKWLSKGLSPYAYSICIHMSSSLRGMEQSKLQIRRRYCSSWHQFGCFSAFAVLPNIVVTVAPGNQLFDWHSPSPPIRGFLCHLVHKRLPARTTISIYRNYYCLFSLAIFPQSFSGVVNNVCRDGLIHTFASLFSLCSSSFDHHLLGDCSISFNLSISKNVPCWSKLRAFQKSSVGQSSTPLPSSMPSSFQDSPLHA